LIQMFQLQLAGAAKMPVSLLWGRMYNGLGNSGEGDERIYEKTIASEADVTLRPAVEKLLPVICMSELGEVPDDLVLDFPSIRVLDEKEKAELAKTVVDSITVCVNTGLMSPRVAAKELKTQSDITGFGSNLTDEAVAALSDKVQAEGEGMGENLFGETASGVPTLNPDSSPSKVLHEEAKVDKEKPPLAEAKDLLGRIARRFGGGEAEDAGHYTPELVWLEACDNEALSVPVALRGTETGQAAMRKAALANLSFYAEQFKVPYDKCLSYVKNRGLAWDARANDEDSPGPEVEVHGLPVVVESWKGEYRGGVTLPYNYGYLKNQKGADGDSLDVALGPNLGADWVYVVDQKKLPPAKGYDESKVLMGYDGLTAAMEAYNAGHRLACLVFGDVTPMQIEDFKRWLKERDYRKPAGTVRR